MNNIYELLTYKKENIYLIVTASNIIITPTKNMAINTPPIMYKLSFGASVIKIKQWVFKKNYKKKINDLNRSKCND